VAWTGAAGLATVIAATVAFSHVSSARPSPPGRRSHRVAAAGSSHSKRGLPASSSGTALDQRLFTSGSCVAYSPTSGDRHETVFIDAGHGGIDPGAVGVTASGTTVYEADETLKVELDAMALLRADGYRVVVSRTRQSTVARPAAGDVAGGVFTVAGENREIAARDVCANLARANILLAVYFDAGGSELNAGSVTTYDRARPFWRKSLRLATLVQRDVLAALNSHGWAIPSDGVLSDVSLGGPPLSSAGGRYGHLMVIGPAMSGYFSTPSTMPGALIEPLFITDPFEASIAASTTGQRAIASGLAEAARQYLSARRG
jgi:N-acetylmuramoyl-L-alanine amidase